LGFGSPKGAGFDSARCRTPRSYAWGPRSDTVSVPLRQKSCNLTYFPVPIRPDARYPPAFKRLKIIIDILYQYAIMVSLGRQDSSPALPAMLARHVVLLTLSGDGNCPLWSYPYTGTLPPPISFVSHSYENCRVCTNNSQSGTLRCALAYRL